ncbi:FeoA family protein [Senegalia massiliensis]|uniref:Ferrous iron transport protein A n=1 Tax=Senegalia massiliensis TaxID=1720316 RepID=A0A845QZ19_9CLOT|nr:FeoA family protein [Senegalia massiliensis]NBI06402.1 ferrous iron transport protein A [Senegalia massiliensis]
MNDKYINLNKLPIGAMGRVKEVTSSGNTRRRMLDLGLINNTIVKSLRKSPLGDPIAYEIRGAVIALRSEESTHIYVEKIDN